MVTRMLMAAALAATVLAAGCGQAMVQGPVVGRVLGFDESDALLTADTRSVQIDVRGGVRSLASLYNDATILVFTERPCLPADADPIRAASQVGRGITIIEISGPADGCDAQWQCATHRMPAAGNVVSLCDARGLLRGAFHVGWSETVLVLDDRGNVRDYGPLEDFQYMRLTAETLAREAAADRRRGMAFGE